MKNCFLVRLCSITYARNIVLRSRKIQYRNSSLFRFAVICYTISGIICGLSKAISQERVDSAVVIGSPEKYYPDNALMERIEYWDGSIARNDFVRDYSAFDTKTVEMASHWPFKDELDYRYNSSRDEITLTLKEDRTSISFIPLLEGQILNDGSGRPYWKKAEGIAAAGSIGENVVFYAKAIDNGVRGRQIDMQGSLSSQPGFVKSAETGDGFDYDETEMQIGIRFGVGQLFLEKIRNTVGYGRGGTLVLSDRAPSFPQLRLAVQLLKNLKFTYIIASLNSNIIDSSQSYIDLTDGTFREFRQVNRSKYLALNIFEYSPLDRLNLALGEWEIFSDRFLPEYLLPIAYLHSLDHQNGALDNGAIWGGARYTYPSYGSLYFTFFIDEINTDMMLNAKNHNVIAETIGGNLISLDRNNLDVTLEYTFINPLVYRNDVTACDATTNGYLIGDWLGENADMFAIWLDYRPIPQIWLSGSYERIRKGQPGSIGVLYGLNMEPGLLDGPILKRRELDLKCRWEFRPNLFADLSYRLVTQNDQVIDRYASFSDRSFLSLALRLNIFDQNDEW